MNKTLQQRLSGVFTALVTPMKDGEIDMPAFEAHLDRQLEAGVAGLSPIGTTGEAPALTELETASLIETTVKRASGKAFVMAGAGANSTRATIERAQRAEGLGADGLLVVVPYYNRPSQAGIADHFAAVGNSVSIPVMVYNVPGRTGVDFSVEAFAKLAKEVPNVIAMKEASGKIDRISDIRLACGNSVAIFTGDDPMTLPALAVGCDGVYSVASNLIPEEMVALVKAWQHKRPDDACAIHYRIYRVMQDLFIESNPVPVKAALARKGWMQPDVRAPLAPLSAANRRTLEATLDALAT